MLNKTPISGASRPACRRAMTRTKVCVQAHRASNEAGDRNQSHIGTQIATMAIAAVMTLGAGGVQPAQAAPRQQPPIVESAKRCTLEALDLFADTRKTFSQEASSGGMTEALVDVRDCDFSGKDLRAKVMSGVLLQGADFSNAKMTGIQMSRADARGANLSGVDFTDTNAYGTLFDGADLRGATFENAILSNASFGKFGGKWADLAGAHFEGALLSSSDIGRVCENPTIDPEVRKFELGCRDGRK